MLFWSSKCLSSCSMAVAVLYCKSLMVRQVPPTMWQSGDPRGLMSLPSQESNPFIARLKTMTRKALCCFSLVSYQVSSINFFSLVNSAFASLKSTQACFSISLSFAYLYSINSKIDTGLRYVTYIQFLRISIRFPLYKRSLLVYFRSLVFMTCINLQQKQTFLFSISANMISRAFSCFS